jgi:hypothetical protein
MCPVVFYGWVQVLETTHILFVLGTLSNVGFGIYDAIKSTLLTFTKHSNPLPVEFWVVIVALHHTFIAAHLF